MERKFDFITVTLGPDNFDMVKEIYRLHKEQRSKLFDLACGIKDDGDIMDYIKGRIEYDTVLLGIDATTGEYAGCVILEEPSIFNNRVTRVAVHLVVSKKYWGKQSREFVFDCYKFLKENWIPIDRMECMVPSNNYGIIKLLKDVGFKVEGTLKKRLIFLDKNNNPKSYDELMYSNLNLGE